jgi:hypothetical protein
VAITPMLGLIAMRQASGIIEIDTGGQGLTDIWSRVMPLGRRSRRRAGPAHPVLPPHLGIAADPGKCGAGRAGGPAPLLRDDRAEDPDRYLHDEKDRTTCRPICARH